MGIFLLAKINISEKLILNVRLKKKIWMFLQFNLKLKHLG